MTDKCLVSSKIYRIFDRLKNTPYNGTVSCKHFSVAIRNGKVITPVLFNYHRKYVFGTKRGTIHAEMNSLNYLMNTDRSFKGFFNNRTSKAEQYVLQVKSLFKIN